MRNKKLPKLIVILGPTASGKTDLTIKLARKFHGEIISADSRQVYKGMDIGTAKAVFTKPHKKEHKTTPKIIQGIPHYLIDVVRPSQEFNVAIYKKEAIKAIKDIQKREEVPFLVGGTGLYIRAVVDNIKFPKVPQSKKLRVRLEKKTTSELFKIYRKLDPAGAKIIDKENKRRLIRAIEVCKSTKKSFWQQRSRGKPFFEVLEIGIRLSKEKLKKRVEKRVEKMFELGLEKEVKKIVKKYGWDIPPLQTIGYQEWFSFASASAKASAFGLTESASGQTKSADKKATEDKKDYIFSLAQREKNEIKTKIILHTIQFAKRQMTWFKKDKRIQWIRTQDEAERLIKDFIKR